MAEAKTAVANKPVWIDLASTDPAASRDYYAKLFGWKVEVNPDPQYGGYGMAKIGGKDVAGIGGTQSPDAPSAWMVYIGSNDSDETVKKVEAAGGKVVVAPMTVSGQGTMTVFQDPSGAFIATWQAENMAGAQVKGEPNSFGWAELNARGIDKATPFYNKVFGWGEKKSEMSPGSEYTEFQIGGESIAGGMEMMEMVPAQVPSYWLVYFNVDDVDKAAKKAIEAGGKELTPPMDMPGGRFAIVSDPQGAAFGLLKMQAS